MKNETLVLLIAGGLLFFAVQSSPQNDGKVSSGTQTIAKKAGEEYISAAAKAFKEVGQECLSGEHKTLFDVHEELADRNDKALDKYIKINELLNEADPDDMEAVGKLCISIGKGLEKVGRR